MNVRLLDWVSRGEYQRLRESEFTIFCQSELRCSEIIQLLDGIVHSLMITIRFETRHLILISRDKHR